MLNIVDDFSRACPAIEVDAFCREGAWRETWRVTADDRGGPQTGAYQ